MSVKDIFKCQGTDFKLRNLSPDTDFSGFSCGKYTDYEDYIKNQSQTYNSLHLHFTHVLIEVSSGLPIAYMSLAVDRILISHDEFLSAFCPSGTPRIAEERVIPSLRIKMLAVNENFRCKYKNVGSYMIFLVRGMAMVLNERVACPYIVVDADKYGRDDDVPSFYEKNHFIRNEIRDGEYISMRYSLFSDR